MSAGYRTDELILIIELYRGCHAPRRTGQSETNLERDRGVIA